MSRRADLAFSLVFVGIVAIVVRGVVAAPAPPSPRTPPPEERARLARQIAAQEDEWRANVVADFPADAWSQRDAFHNLEMQSIRDLAVRAKIAPEEIFRAIDEDLHRPTMGVERSAGVVPLKPRPIFD
ncbi:MAG: hypothetical protein JST00_42610 [Deltaproteobacteria bacterium]|nr:hypothetical protein [Deltaproteobacteria bacterium]